MMSIIKKAELTEAELNGVCQGLEGMGREEWGDIGQNVQTSGYKMNLSSQYLIYSMMIIVNILNYILESC